MEGYSVYLNYVISISHSDIQECITVGKPRGENGAAWAFCEWNSNEKSKFWNVYRCKVL